MNPLLGCSLECTSSSFRHTVRHTVKVVFMPNLASGGQNGASLENIQFQ